MTPKEKANELIENSYQIIIDLVDVNNAFYYSKQCALITVDEIIELENFSVEGREYWKQVKQEIENYDTTRKETNRG